jgi:hypothetical protein
MFLHFTGQPIINSTTSIKTRYPVQKRKRYSTSRRITSNVKTSGWIKLADDRVHYICTGLVHNVIILTENTNESKAQAYTFSFGR